MYSYGQVETALAAVHQIPPNAIGAFRGRIKHFQRIGLVPASPGKGKRIAYILADVYVWGFCLELAEFGMDPMTIIKIAKRIWNTIFYTAFGQELDSDLYFLFHPALLGKDFAADLLQSAESPDGAPSSISWLIGRDLSTELDSWPKSVQTQLAAAKFRARHGTINLSKLRRDIDSALGAA